MVNISIFLHLIVFLWYLDKIVSFISLQHQTCSLSYFAGPVQPAARSLLGLCQWWSLACRVGEHHEPEKSNIFLLGLRQVIWECDSQICLCTREGDFCLFVEVLEQLVPLFFIPLTTWTMPAKFQFTSEIWSLLPNPLDVNFRSIVSGFFRRREIDSLQNCWTKFTNRRIRWWKVMMVRLV